MVGHLSYLLLVISMLMRSMTLLRMLVIASAFVAITYDVVWLKDPVGVFWETLLVVVNIVQISREWLEERRVSLTPEEHRFVKSRLRGISKRNAKRLLNLGSWQNGLPGTVLTTENEPVEHVIYLTEGCVDILVGGIKVAECGPGNFVGEMSFVGNAPASATATVAEPARFWQIAGDRLLVLQDTDPDLAAALEVGIARDMRSKIISHNEQLSADYQPADQSR